MANVLKHRFVSGKADGPDATQVQPSHWNDGHGFTGGAAGDVLTRDPADATFGARWGNPITTITYDGTATPYVPVPVGAGMMIDVDCANLTAISIHGIEVPAGLRFGTRVTIRARSTGDVLLLNAGASAPASGAFLNWVVSGPTPLSAGALLDGSHPGGTGASATYVFDGARWRLVAHEQGRPIKVPFNAANFAGITGQTATLHDYYVHGTDAHVRVCLVGGTVGAGVAAVFIGGWPFTFTPGSQNLLLPASTSVGGYGLCFTRVDTDFARIRFEQLNFATWPAALVDFMGDFTTPIR